MSDTEIIQAFEQDPNRGMRALISVFTPYLYGLVRPMLDSHEDSDEVLQLVFIHAWKGLHRFRADSALKTWLHRIAVRTAWDFIKKQKAHTKRAIERQAEASTHDALASNPQLLLLHALSELPPKQRLIFVLRYFENMPFAELSTLTQTTEGNVKAQYHHAKTKLEQYFLLQH
jgi:RNA polymerase sigma-70 factor, ECF subfamily